MCFDTNYNKLLQEQHERLKVVRFILRQRPEMSGISEKSRTFPSEMKPDPGIRICPACTVKRGMNVHRFRYEVGKVREASVRHSMGRGRIGENQDKGNFKTLVCLTVIIAWMQRNVKDFGNRRLIIRVISLKSLIRHPVGR